MPKKTVLKDNEIVNIVVVEDDEWNPPEGHTVRDFQDGDGIPSPTPVPDRKAELATKDDLTPDELKEAMFLWLRS